MLEKIVDNINSALVNLLVGEYVTSLMVKRVNAETFLPRIGIVTTAFFSLS
jgi:hypothetical protein